ncbi:alpha/beta superfamily hydrolase [Variovorax sp. TBS-050B]|uniref:alpha/beta hydrolase n=1 Tax=Variovorax sp. TBS-050B TaxID=2940551 RepID=UPI002475A915|nr:alpha/beta fold hydrolase [Variovorax sp. TBS-050B]MDH6591696.1 alpha/beta superfamily hydrolase [Variovorax sp. TBS-050B]
MNSQTEKIRLQGAAGAIEVQRDRPAEASAARGIAVIAHPHPLFGGTMDNKVVQTLARAFVACGWTAVRFNFRGVGASEGAHDEGRGECEDMLEVVRQLAPEGPLAIAGFSFGAFVASSAAEKLWAARDIRQLVLVGTAAARFTVPALPAEAHERTLVIHGEADDTVPLAAVMDWARPQSLPVTVVPGGGHFFHGQLPLLKSLVVRHLRADAA